MKRLIILVLLVFSVLLTSCEGWVISSTLNETSTEYVCLEMFENFTNPYQPGLEVRLNKAISDSLMTSGFILRSKPIKSDVTVSGRILEHKQTVLSTSPDQNPTEISVVIKVRFNVRWKSGETDTFVRRNFKENFAIALNERLSDAETRALKEIARDIMLYLSGEELPEN